MTQNKKPMIKNFNFKWGRLKTGESLTTLSLVIFLEFISFFFLCLNLNLKLNFSLGLRRFAKRISFKLADLIWVNKVFFISLLCDKIFLALSLNSFKILTTRRKIVIKTTLIVFKIRAGLKSTISPMLVKTKIIMLIK